MATKRPSKPSRTLIQEASDPSTEPERLRELAYHKEEAVQRTSLRNPSLPEDVWRTFLLTGEPDAWNNPMASLYLLTWTQREQDQGRTLDDSIPWAMKNLWKEPERWSSEGKALLTAKVQEWWANSESAEEMTMDCLDLWLQMKTTDSVEYREVVRILVLCVRTAPNLTTKDHEALNLLEAWSIGGKDQRRKAESLADSEAVKSACRFALDHGDGSTMVIHEVLDVVVSDKIVNGRYVLIAKQDQLLADLIRREMPLPPVVE
jgi:hypothetical protein